MPNRISPGQLELWADPTPAPTAPCAAIAERRAGEQQDPESPTFTLECTDASVPETRSLDQDFAKRRPLKILVADDNAINRKIIRVILQKLGYSCVEAENGEEALSLHRDSDYDYIFMDLDMPEMDGLETTQAIREAEGSGDRRTEIIAVTANVSPETRLKCRRVGMNGYLEKPITAAVIKEQLLRSWPRLRSQLKG